MITLSLTLFVIFGLLFLIAGMVAALSLLWFIIKWGLIIAGIYMLAREFVKIIS